MPKSPPKIAMLKELHVVKDLVSLLYPRVGKHSLSTNVHAKHVVLIPPVGTDKRYLKPLAAFLERQGHIMYDWGLGVNDAGLKRKFSIEDISDDWTLDATDKPEPINTKELGVAYLCTVATRRIKALSELLETPVVVIGWSLGGYIAREVTRDLPEHVSQVISFGTPVIGGPKYTSTVEVFRNQGINIDWLEQLILKRSDKPITQAITAMYGIHDGIVDASVCIDEHSPNVSHHAFNTCHFGLGFHYPLWQLVLKKLSD